MKHLIIALGIALSLSSCGKKAQSTSTEGNDIKVEFLFEKDGVKVYRFRDFGNYHYFTTRGESMTTQSSGKTHYEENL
jgi:hypothetical protein